MLNPIYESPAYDILLKAKKHLEKELVTPDKTGDSSYGPANWDHRPNPDYNPQKGYELLKRAMTIYSVTGLQVGELHCAAETVNVPLEKRFMDLHLDSIDVRVRHREIRSNDTNSTEEDFIRVDEYVRQYYEIIRKYATDQFVAGNEKPAKRIFERLKVHQRLWNSER